LIRVHFDDSTNGFVIDLTFLLSYS
jgi:hypothetical protein